MDGVRVVVGKRLDGPCFGFGLRYAETVHQVEAPADVVVVASGDIAYAPFFHKAAHGAFGMCGSRLLPSAFLPGGGCHPTVLRSGRRILDLHRFSVGTVERVGIVADHGHAGGVLALPVYDDAGEPGVVVVDRLPGRGEVLSRHFVCHTRDDTYALPRQRLVGQERVRVGLCLGERLIEKLAGNAVDVHHDEARIALDVLCRTPTCQDDGGNEGGLVLFDLALLTFQDFVLQFLAGRKRAKLGGGGGMAAAGKFLYDFFPCAGSRYGRTER